MDKLIFQFLNHKAVYFRVTKVDSMSLLQAFRKTDEVEKVEDYNKSYFKFAFVRNPFDRLASAYRHIILRQAVGTVYKNKGIYKGMPFDSFIDVISKTPVEDLDIHFRPQWTFIPEKPDFLGKFESLNEDYKKICELIKIKYIPLQWDNATGKTIYKNYYSDKNLVNKVIKIYEKDFYFDYKKELPKD